VNGKRGEPRESSRRREFSRHRYSRCSDQQRRGQHAGLPNCVDAVPHAEENCAAVRLRRLHRAGQAVRRRMRSRWMSGSAPNNWSPSTSRVLIRYPGALQVVDFADGRVRLVGIRARCRGGPPGGPGRCAPCASTFPRAGRPESPPIYSGRQERQAGGRYRWSKTAIEVFFFLAARKDIRVVMKEMRPRRGPCAPGWSSPGGGNIGFRLASELEDKKSGKAHRTRRQGARRRVSEQLKSTTVLHGDAAG